MRFGLLSPLARMWQVGSWFDVCLLVQKKVRGVHAGLPPKELAAGRVCGALGWVPQTAGSVMNAANPKLSLA